MRISQAFSSYIKAADLQGREIPVVIDRVVMEQIGGDQGEKKEKPVVYFRGKKLGWVLNMTNAGTIADAYGDETSAWVDREIVLFPAKAQFGREIVDAIRVRIPTGMPRDHLAPGGALGSAITHTDPQAPINDPIPPLGEPDRIETVPAANPLGNDGIDF